MTAILGQRDGLTVTTKNGQRRQGKGPTIGKRARRRIGTAITVSILSIGAIGYLMPFFWMLSTSLKHGSPIR